MNNYNGILIVNKPSGITSRDVVNIVGKTLNTKKVGHTGTLDPMATGVLVLCLGNALKVCELITANDKEYIAKVILGIETETLDTTSPIINTKKTNITKEEIEKVLNSFKGSYIQEVPKYSAVKINGKKLYEYAREGKEIELPKKMVTIYDIQLVSDITYYNDTIATIPEATISGIEALKNVNTLIFGGMDRGIDYNPLINYLKSSNVENLICMPETGYKIGKELENTSKNIIYVETLEEAVIKAKEITKKSTICLLSPSAPSYNYFKNYIEKGNKYKELIKNN